MTNGQINIKKLIQTIRQTNIYTPIIEAVVNGIEAIDDAKVTDKKITVTLIRDQQVGINYGATIEEQTPAVVSVKISDNGIGFTNENLNAFNYIYTEAKADRGGKGFGRFVFLKYFKRAKITSVYKDNGDTKKRFFDFINADIFTQNNKIEPTTEHSTGTEVFLESLYDEHFNKLDKRLETISRKLLEYLLVYFTLDNYTCPTITVVDEQFGKSIVLNTYINNKDGIYKLLDKDFELISDDGKDKQNFKAKIFKINYGESRSSINLVANNRQVTDIALYEYIPEFKDDFYDVNTNDKGEKISKGYTIKAYVSGSYLDSNVSETRDYFLFHKHHKTLYLKHSQADIEKVAANIAKEAVSSEVKVRQEKKKARVREYVNSQAPYHRSYLDKLDYSVLPIDCSDEEIDSALQKTKFLIETSTKNTIKGILDTDKFEFNKKFKETVDSITGLGESELSHYVVLRKLVLELFKRSLSWDDKQQFDKEKVIHDIIFPTKTDSDSIPYEQHNLWIVDEKLCFHEYLASDKPLNTKDERPDIIIFDKKIPLRNGDDLANPIVVVEFKKPQREEYSAEDNPLKQIANYVDKIRKKDFKTPEGRTINVNENTPAFGYLICDLTKKIHEFCNDFDLTLSPDNQGYFGYHKGYKIYFEVISFDKLVKDAEQRNKIFFKKLHIN